MRTQAVRPQDGCKPLRAVPRAWIAMGVGRNHWRLKSASLICIPFIMLCLRYSPLFQPGNRNRIRTPLRSPGLDGIESSSDIGVALILLEATSKRSEQKKSDVYSRLAEKRWKVIHTTGTPSARRTHGQLHQPTHHRKSSTSDAVQAQFCSA